MRLLLLSRGSPKLPGEMKTLYQRNLLARPGTVVLLILGLALTLGGCVPIGGVLKEEPDATVNFDTGWQDIVPCAKDQLGTTFESATVKTTSDSAQLTVAGNYFGSTIMIVDIRDATPGKAEALIHAHDYMVLWGGPTRRAVAALKKCPVKPAPSP